MTTKKMRFLTLATVILMAIVLSSCAGAGHSQRRGTYIGTGVGAGIGAVLGQVLGGDTEATLIGAGIGAALGGVAGNQIGAYMDRQEQELRSAMAYSQAMILQREGDVLRATFNRTAMFASGSSTLMSGAVVDVQKAGYILAKYADTLIAVDGHTDSDGSDAGNMELSKLRAGAVANVLVSCGVAAQRIRVTGYGSSQPISSSKAMNRRVEITIAPTQAANSSQAFPQ